MANRVVVVTSTAANAFSTHPFQVYGKQFNVSVYSTSWTGTVTLYRAFGSTIQSTAWRTADSWTANFEGTADNIEPGTYYRIGASALSAGSVECRLGQNLNDKP